MFDQILIIGKIILVHRKVYSISYLGVLFNLGREPHLPDLLYPSIKDPLLPQDVIYGAPPPALSPVLTNIYIVRDNNRDHPTYLFLSKSSIQ